MGKRSKPREVDDGPPMRCALCKRCWERLDDDGRRTGDCIYGGPYVGWRLAPSAASVEQPCYPHSMPSRSISPRRRAERDLPHVVDIEVPEEGLGPQINAMMTWCGETFAEGAWAQHSATIKRPFPAMPLSVARFRFLAADDAAAFRKEWAEP